LRQKTRRPSQPNAADPFTHLRFHDSDGSFITPDCTESEVPYQNESSTPLRKCVKDRKLAIWNYNTGIKSRKVALRRDKIPKLGASQL
jgi:hypothetical protein